MRVLENRHLENLEISTFSDGQSSNEIRLSLRQNSVIPKEKQIQFFYIEPDKVWFEDEYNYILETNKKYIREKLALTEDKREDEEPMEMKINVAKSREDIPYAYTITDIEILKVLNKETGVEEPKVTKVFFVDGTNMKMVCHEEDTFDLRRCLFIAIAKKLFKDRYTWEGIEHKAIELSYLKSANKVVDKALKDYSNKIKEAEKKRRKLPTRNVLQKIRNVNMLSM